MWAEFERALRAAATRTVENVASALPGILVLIVLLGIALAVAIGVRTLLLRTLERLDLDRRGDRVGLPAGEGPHPRSVATFVASVGFWLILLLGLLAGLTAFDAPLPNQLAITLFAYIPNIIAAVVIVLLGSVLARFLARTVLIGAVNMRLGSPRVLSLLVKWLVIVVATAMALEHLAIGRTVLFMAFAFFFGGVMLALSIALGIGARDYVRQTLDRQLHTPAPGGDKIDHV
jgi:hypothetical protein